MYVVAIKKKGDNVEAFKGIIIALFVSLLWSGLCFGSGYLLCNRNIAKRISSLITNLENNNNDMKNLLDLQTKDYETLQRNYTEKSATTDKQLQNYQELLKLSENKNLIYKYGIAGAFVVGVLLGVFVAK